LIIISMSYCNIHVTSDIFSKNRKSELANYRFNKQVQHQVNKNRAWSKNVDLQGLKNPLARRPGHPCTTWIMYISLTIFLFRSGIVFYFHLFSTVQVTVRPKRKICVFMVIPIRNLTKQQSVTLLKPF
jgi:hypothetical protein